MLCLWIIKHKVSWIIEIDTFNYSCKFYKLQIMCWLLHVWVNAVISFVSILDVDLIWSRLMIWKHNLIKNDRITLLSCNLQCWISCSFVDMQRLCILYYDHNDCETIYWNKESRKLYKMYIKCPIRILRKIHRNILFVWKSWE